ncbi:glutamate racemase [Marinilabiliaceae bacterium ANBcel2]|nr:glutamate racemase [Marinilabiliaceae bacterium ANBcel2]
MVKRSPIAIFDSGYGGLTVMYELIKNFPEHDFIYFGDNARAPYGERSFEVVYKYTLQAVKKLFAFNAPLIILACNTASAKALRTIQQDYLPQSSDPTRRVLGVIRPSVEIAGSLTKNGYIGVMGTKGTIRSLSYPIELNKLYPGINVIQQDCPMWVPLVENGEHLSIGADFFVKKNIEELLSKSFKIDTIILGCTHYPILMPLIKKHLPPKVKIVSQGSVIKESLQNYLLRHPEINNRITRTKSREFYTSENCETFNSAASLFLKQRVNAKQIIVE